MEFSCFILDRNKQKYNEAKNILEELKILYKIKYELNVFVYEVDYIDFIQDKSKDFIGLTSGFIEKLNRNEKTYILEHLLFIEKEDGFNAYEITPSIKQNKDKYNNICGDEFCRYLDDLDKRFGTKKKLDSLEINDKDKSFAFYMRDYIKNK